MEIWIHETVHKKKICVKSNIKHYISENKVSGNSWGATGYNRCCRCNGNQENQVKHQKARYNDNPESKIKFQKARCQENPKNSLESNKKGYQ